MKGKQNTVWITVIALCVAGILTGCGNLSAAVGSGYIGAIPQSSAAPMGAVEQTMVTYTVETSACEESVEAEDGTLLAQCRYELPTLHAFRTDGSEITEPVTSFERNALDVVQTFDETFENWARDADFSGIAEMAGDVFAEDPEYFRQGGFYAAELTFSSWQTEHLVSICAQYYSNTGGNHPNRVLLGWNFDLDTGAFLEPTALAEDTQTFLHAVADEIIRQAGIPDADGRVPADEYWEDYQNIVLNWPSYAVSFDETGMNIGFSPYDLACYAAGEQIFTIDYAFLREFLSNQGGKELGLPGSDD